MPDWVFQLLTLAVGGGGVYAAIRADLARLHIKADTAAATASRAHQRIDNLLMKGN